MLTFTSIKRSPPMSEEEAKLISKEVHLFGYEPAIVEHEGNHHLIIRGDGWDDDIIEHRLFQLRKPTWKDPA